VLLWCSAVRVIEVNALSEDLLTVHWQHCVLLSLWVQWVVTWDLFWHRHPVKYLLIVT